MTDQLIDELRKLTEHYQETSMFRILERSKKILKDLNEVASSQSYTLADKSRRLAQVSADFESLVKDLDERWGDREGDHE